MPAHPDQLDSSTAAAAAAGEGMVSSLEERMAVASQRLGMDLSDDALVLHEWGTAMEEGAHPA